MDLCDGFKVQVQEYEGHRFIAIRCFYTAEGELKPGIPGFNLNPHQWEKLKQLRRQLVHSAVNRHNVTAKLGYDKLVEVKRGVIWLKRLPEDCTEDFLKRNSVELTPRLWRELWKKAEWLSGELRGKSPDSEYELDPKNIKIEAGTSIEHQETWPSGEEADDGEKTLLIAQSDNATAELPLPVASSTPPSFGRIPQQDSNLALDPLWYQTRAATGLSGSSSRKRKLPWPLRRMDPIKFPKLTEDDDENDIE